MTKGKVRYVTKRILNSTLEEKGTEFLHDTIRYMMSHFDCDLDVDFSTLWVEDTKSFDADVKEIVIVLNRDGTIIFYKFIHSMILDAQTEGFDYTNNLEIGIW